MNEAEGRAVYPFTSMTLADAWLWGSYRGDLPFMSKLDDFTKDTMDTKRGYYGVICDQCVIKSTKTVKDVNFSYACNIFYGYNKGKDSK
jgi:hypothetical protein